MLDLQVVVFGVGGRVQDQRDDIFIVDFLFSVGQRLDCLLYTSDAADE